MNQQTSLTPSRKDVRSELGRILAGSGTGYQAIYTYQNDDLAGESPVLRIMSSGSLRTNKTFKGSFAVFAITLQSLVLYKDGQGDHTVWTPENAEDKLDDLERSLSATLYSIEWPREGLIKNVSQAGVSTVRKDVVQGKTYLIEYIPLRVEAYYGQT